MLISVYALLPLEWRFSRAVTLIYLIFTVPVLMVSQSLINLINFKVFTPYYNHPKSIAILGSVSSFTKIEQILLKSSVNFDIVGRVGISDEDISHSIGHVDQLQDLINIYDISELITCVDDVAMNKVFSLLKKLGNKIQFKVYSKANLGIIGSNDPAQSGEVYTTDLSFNITTISSKVFKRIFDLVATIIYLLSIPFLFIRPKDVKPNIISILLGRMSWIGYDERDDNLDVLPVLKMGCLKITDNFSQTKDQEVIHWQNLQYAKNYSVFIDIEHFLKYIFTKKSND